jgi:NAD+ kinase
MKSKSFGILTKPRFPEIESTLREVVGWLRARSIDVVLDTTSAMFPFEQGGIRKPAGEPSGCSILRRRRNPAQCRATCRERSHVRPEAQHVADSVFDRGPVDNPYPSLNGYLRMTLFSMSDSAPDAYSSAWRNGCVRVVLNDVVISKGTLHA